MKLVILCWFIILFKTDDTVSVLSFVKEPTNLTVTPYGTKQLYCEAKTNTDDSVIYYQWLKNGVLLKYKESELQTLEVGSNNTGVFNCLVSDSFGRVISRDAHVTMQVLRVFDSEYSEFTVKDCGKVLLEFPRYQSSPPITSFVWKRYSRISDYTIVIPSSYYTLNGGLFLPISKQNGDEATYTLFVTWSSYIDHPIKVVRVRVTDDLPSGVQCMHKQVEYYHVPKDAHVYVGDNVQLEFLIGYRQCMDSIPQYWYIGGSHYLSYNSTLRLYNVTMADTNTYTFSYTADTVTHTETVKVFVYERPQIIFHPLKTVISLNSKSVMLNGAILSNPSAVNVSVGWLLDGKPLDQNTSWYRIFTNGSLLLHSIEVSNSGYYQVAYTFYDFDKKDGANRTTRGVLKDVIKLKVIPEFVGCGGKYIGTSGSINLYNNSNIDHIFHITFCTWLIIFPTSSRISLNFKRFQFAGVSDSQQDCLKTRVRISTGYHGSNTELEAYCNKSPPTDALVINAESFFVKATIKPQLWKNNGFVLNFYEATPDSTTVAPVTTRPSTNATHTTPVTTRPWNNTTHTFRVTTRPSTNTTHTTPVTTRPWNNTTHTFPVTTRPSTNTTHTTPVTTRPSTNATHTTAITTRPSTNTTHTISTTLTTVSTSTVASTTVTSSGTVTYLPTNVSIVTKVTEKTLHTHNTTTVLSLKKKQNGEHIIYIVAVCGIAILVLFIVGVYVVYRRKQKKVKKEKPELAGTNEYIITNSSASVYEMADIDCGNEKKVDENIIENIYAEYDLTPVCKAKSLANANTTDNNLYAALESNNIPNNRDLRPFNKQNDSDTQVRKNSLNNVHHFDTDYTLNSEPVYKVLEPETQSNYAQISKPYINNYARLSNAYAAFEKAPPSLYAHLKTCSMDAHNTEMDQSKMINHSRGKINSEDYVLM